MPEIDLSLLTQNRVTMLTGHPRGLSARELFDLDHLDDADGQVEILAPEDLDTITPSFVQGFLAASLSKLGADRLRMKYDVSRLPSVLQEDFETGIQRLLLHKRNFQGSH